MRSTATVLCVVVLLGAVGASAAVSGRITDTAGLAVPNAQISFTSDDDPGIVLMATSDPSGNYQLDLPTAVADSRASNHAPRLFSLQQNYPNPFNPSTIIPFSLEQAGRVRLTVFNTMGQTVRTLVDDHLSAGTYHVAWDGYDDAGMGVGAGVYLYQLVASGMVQSHSMVLVDGASPAVSRAGATATPHLPGPTGKPAAGTYTVNITAETIEPYVLPGLAIAGDESLNFVAVNRNVVIVVARMVAKADQIETASSELLALLELTRGEPGNLRYDLIQATDNPAVFLFYEEWRSEDAIAAHMETQHFQDFYGQVETLFLAENGLRVTRYKEISPPRVDDLVDPDLITVITRLECNPGKADLSQDIMLPFLHKTRGESGCLGYDLHRSTEDPQVFMLFENWDGQEAVDYHLGTPFFQEFYGQFGELFSVVEVNISTMLSQPEQ